MPRPRVTETAPRISRGPGPPNLRTSSCDSDQQHPRPRTDKNPKPTDGRSIRAVDILSDPSKLGTRIANLESQLGLAQVELQSLKDQLVSTESAKKDQHDKKPKIHIEDKTLNEVNSFIVTCETSDYSIEKETDVFEVPVDKLLASEEPKTELEFPDDENSKNGQINLLKASLDEKEKELEAFRQENTSLKRQLDEKSLRISLAQAETDELTMRLANISQELEKNKTNGVEVKEKLELTEKAKEELENEMKRVRVQSEQWRKAADAAASVLAEGMEINGRRLSERCGSMDKVYTNTFDMVDDDVFGGEKRKGSGIRMLGELWKKKGQK